MGVYCKTAVLRLEKVAHDLLERAMTTHVRPMKLDDINDVHAIELLAHRVPWSRDVLNDCVLVHYDCRVLEHKHQKVAQIIGYLICRYATDICHILNLSIAPDFQKLGYGSFLLKNLLDSIVDLRMKTVVLEVRPSNLIAIHLYRKFGFEPFDIKPGYYCDDQGFEDAILLRKLLIK